MQQADASNACTSRPKATKRSVHLAQRQLQTDAGESAITTPRNATPRITNQPRPLLDATRHYHRNIGLKPIFQAATGRCARLVQLISIRGRGEERVFFARKCERPRQCCARVVVLEHERAYSLSCTFLGFWYSRRFWDHG